MNLEESRRELRAMAYEQADLMQDGRVNREDALTAIAERFPELSVKQVGEALAQGLFESR